MAESGRFEQRPDVEPEAVGDHDEGQVLGPPASRERRERRIEGTVFEGEPDQFLVAPSNVAASATRTSRRPTSPASKARSTSASALAPSAEPLQQVHAHVVHACGPVEVHDHGADIGSIAAG